MASWSKRWRQPWLRQTQAWAWARRHLCRPAVVGAAAARQNGADGVVGGAQCRRLAWPRCVHWGQRCSLAWQLVACQGAFELCDCGHCRCLRRRVGHGAPNHAGLAERYARALYLQAAAAGSPQAHPRAHMDAGLPHPPLADLRPAGARPACSRCRGEAADRAAADALAAGQVIEPLCAHAQMAG